MRTEEKRQLTQRRHWRVRKKVYGTRERPRMSVRLTGKHIYVQFIDDLARVTLASASTRHKSNPDRGSMRVNVDSARRIGTLAAEAAKSQGVQNVVFDRGGKRYHGRIKALADAAREAGLKF